MESCNPYLRQCALARGIVHLGNLERFYRVFQKAQQGKPITVGFLGGSITQDSAASRHENCYAYRTYLWWKNKFPESEVRYVNAGIGATTSQFGAARVEEDLFCYEPDVVFCEFSVNDPSTPFFQECFEGLVRKILYSRTQPALLVFHNVVYDTGENAQDIHSAVSIRYDVPTISMKDSIFEEIRLGYVQREKITQDNLHPNDLGHSYVAQVLTHALMRIYEICAKTPQEVCKPLAKIPPMTQNRYEQAFRVRGRDCLQQMEGFSEDLQEQNGVRDVFRRGFFSSCEGAFLTFRVTAKKISVQYRKTVHHPAPTAAVFVDGGEAAQLKADFEETWGDCLYLQDVWEEEEAKEHTVTIRITNVFAPSCTPFYFVSLICC